MKQFIIVIFTLTLFSCRNEKQLMVDAGFIDSLIINYKIPAAIKVNEAEITFWKNRIDPKNPGIVNESKYAGALMSRFHLTGDIMDVKTADSILKKIDTLFDHKEAAPNLSLAGHYILEHRFTEADAALQKATTIGLKKYDQYAASFDVNLELGRYMDANSNLYNIRAENDYGYKFRQSKWQHYKGNMDSSISAMQKAIALSGNDINLRQAALSNTADLYLHNGELQKANDLYMQSIRLSAADLHSILGLGWIALVHDKNILLAEKIFRFVKTKTTSPDPLLKLVQTAEATNDSNAAKQFTNEFILKVSDSLYGNMYNKYLIDLYTSVLNQPAKAAAISAKELTNRATPQTYAWYVYTLYKNGKGDEAFKMYQQKVSGKPLEGLELYWIGKMMQGLKKGYNAKEYFEEAYKNRYDLSPAKIKDLETIKK
jgi:hypothetical protein